jgi:hypothetical protein
MRRLLLVVAAVVVLAGCRLDVGVDVAMQADGTGTVMVTATADAELVNAAPSALGDLRLDDIRAAGWTVAIPTRAADGSQTVTLTKPFGTPAEATAILGELNGPNGPLQNLTVSLERSFAVVSSSLTGAVQLTGGIGAFSDAALAQALGSQPLANLVTQPIDQAMGLTVTARFPGRVTSASGEIAADRASVTWRPPLTDGTSTALDAHFEQVDQGARDARRTSRLAWGALALYGVLFAAVLIAVVVVLRRRRPPSAGTRPGGAA